MATIPDKLSESVRSADDTLLLCRQLGQWEHRNIADEQALEQALRRWPLLAELAELTGGQPSADTRYEADI
ncbi:hypothetical protein GU3_14420 [Oceanimonas sp. GK1]|uniref:BcsR/BcsP family cellulose biosynthesis protein n=1 Tax=Oceanimonas sp. (strain GK1 / IBRC-M 10197) TaxID=511062 RepID=UPI0002494FC3|nr:BcsR/BcsP family cellulose biosynthesis protein [Oceanimonas sp. GK1]AEY02637.1 hypothetical protein GU3_14420 [Oceanimonas sp. GK1]